MVDFASSDLRVLREVAERGSFSAAARALGYSQSAISRRAAALEVVAGRALFERRHEGVRLTPAGSRLLLRATVVLAELDAARRELEGPVAGDGPVRVGAFASALASLLPAALRALRAEHPGVRVTVREATTPALVRALRAGTTDLAVLASSPPFRPFDAESPALVGELLSERELLVAVGPTHPFCGRDAVEVGELDGQPWIAGRSDSPLTRLGVWPGLQGRPLVVATADDWLAKLALVDAGVGITTVPAVLVAALPPGVGVVAVRGEPEEVRRLLVARSPARPLTPAVTAVIDALRVAAAG